MTVEVQFWSYFKDLTGCENFTAEVAEGTPLGGVLERIFTEFPKLRQMHRSMIVAVGVDYQDKNYILKPGDKVSLFPPVQGG